MLLSGLPRSYLQQLVEVREITQDHDLGDASSWDLRLGVRATDRVVLEAEFQSVRSKFGIANVDVGVTLLGGTPSTSSVARHRQST